MATAGATIIKALAINRLFMGFSFLEVRMICKITEVNNASDLQSQISKLDLVEVLRDSGRLTGFLSKGRFFLLKIISSSILHRPHPGFK